jgi:hypothetical protein
LRKKIVDEILTLRCPRCKIAFVDFVNCFALTCSNKNCNAGFCAWCLFDAGNDAHQHVFNCKEGNGNIFGGEEGTFENHHKKRKGVLIDKELDKVRPVVAKIAYGLLKVDIIGGGIVLKYRG